MGYETQYALAVVDAADPKPYGSPDSDEIIATLRQENEYAEYALTSDGDTNNACKWYDACQDIRAFSEKYPGKLFILRGYGEEATDVWIAYFLEGNAYQKVAQMVYPTYGEALRYWGMPINASGEFAPSVEMRRTYEYQHRIPRLVAPNAGPIIDGECHQ